MNTFYLAKARVKAIFRDLTLHILDNEFFISFYSILESATKKSLKISEKRQSFLPIFSSLINRIDLLSQPACKRRRKKNKSKNYTEYTANEISKSIDKIQ